MKIGNTMIPHLLRHRLPLNTASSRLGKAAFSSQPTVRSQWENAKRLVKETPTEFRKNPLTDLSLGAAFLEPSAIHQLFPSLQGSKAEVVSFVKNYHEKNVITNYYNLHQFADTPKFDGRTELVSTEFTINLQNEKQEQSAQYIRHHFPQLFQLALDGGARLAHFLGTKIKPPTYLIVRFRLYYPDWNQCTVEAHHDGHPAIHIPIHSENCIGTTTFSSCTGKGIPIIRGEDIPCITDDRLPHSTHIVKKNTADSEQAFRGMINVCLI